MNNTSTPAPTTCTLTGDDSHANMHLGTWPVAQLSPTTGSLVVSNTRGCTCGADRGMVVFY